MVCAYCGDIFRAQSLRTWAYKRRNKKGKMHYFCSWNCLCKIDRGEPINHWKIPFAEEDGNETGIPEEKK